MVMKSFTVLNNPYKNCYSMGTPSSSSGGHYSVREPTGKRHATDEDTNLLQAPRSKRRFERVNSMLHDFSISSDKPFIIESSDDEMGYDSSPCSPVIIEEPEELNPTTINLDPKLKGYLERAKQAHNLLPSVNIRGNEVAIWRPIKSVNPFDDPTMTGRIQDVSEDIDQPKCDISIDDGNVSTPASSDDEMSVESQNSITSPQIVELQEDDYTSDDDNTPMDLDY